MKNSLSAIFLAFLTLTVNCASAQLSNFDANGHKTNIASEKIVLSLNKQQVNEVLPALALAGVTALVSVGTDAVKAALDKRALSFTSTYNGMITDNTYSVVDGGFTPFDLNITRKTSETPSTIPADLASSITLTTDFDGVGNPGLFRFKVREINFIKSKARITGWLHSKGKSIDLNVDIQVNVIYRDGITFVTDPVTKVSSITYTYKTVNLGESSITVQGLTPGTDLKIQPDNTDNSYYSDWYQLLPIQNISAANLAALQVKKIDPNKCWITIKATVKEANSYGVAATQLSSFFDSNSGDINGFLKSLIPAAPSKN